MLLTVIVACEIGFWLLLGCGLTARYVLGLPRVGAALLLAVPIVDLVLLAATIVHLRGATTTADFAHGMAAAYLGFTVAFGHATIRNVDVRFAHRFAGGPPPPAPPSEPRARAQREWRGWRRALLGWAVACGLLLGGIALVGDAGRTGAFVDWIGQLSVLLAISLAWPVFFELQARRQAVPQPATAGRRSSRVEGGGSEQGAGARR